MSTESAKAFLDKLDTDMNLRAQLFTSGDASAERVAVSAERLTELGAQQGFVFDAEEIRKAFAERGGSNAGEMADRELDRVAGGTKVKPSDFVFTKVFDKSSPLLG